MANEIQIRAATEVDAQAWDDYVLAHAEGTFFHRYGWKRLIESNYRYPGHYLLAERDGAIVGVFPLGEVKHLLFGHSLISVPFCVYGGVLADDDAAREALEQRAMQLARQLKVDHLEARNERPMRDDWLRKEGLYVTFKRELSAEHDENMQAIPRKQRAMVRKGIKAGLVGELDDGIDNLYEAYSHSVRNLGTPVFPKSHFAAIRKEFGDDVDVVTIFHEGQVVASVMNYYFRDQVLPFYGGGISEARNLAANDFMYWEVMHRAVERGCRVFDFGRSKIDTGSYRFKKHWGFEPTPLNYEYHLVKATEMPDLNPNNPKYRLFINAWKKLPVGVSRIIGPWLARGLA
ncbi:FemAB family XrtA/PEP-CTERM system-associated protein [Thiosocius teredinicola]|uniref:FemAB family XrtA/PEP-CTERM system-associated protein n=1 Tax=Thiosocius teredinicola TaxID=1973002 RepID=UPI000991124D